MNEHMNHIRKCIDALKFEQVNTIIALDEGYIVSENLIDAINALYADKSKYEQDITKDIEQIKCNQNPVILFISDYLYQGKLSELLDEVLAKYKDAYILTDVANSGNTEIVMRLFSGDGCEYNAQRHYTVKYIDRLVNEKGYVSVAVNDILGLEVDESYSYLLNENSLISQYIRDIKNSLDENADVSRIIRLYEKTEVHEKKDNDSEKNCFLSIIMRTQGNRTHELEEALLCVFGQTDDDYEILLMGHNLDEQGKANVDQIIANTPKAIQDKIRYIDVVGGTRTTPLIRGFEEARGEYVSILDDDDIVFDNWIEEFHKLAKDNHGKILHAYCTRQDWLRIDNPYGGDGLRAFGTFERLYCRDFDEITQLSNNTCPIHSLAFPLSAYNVLGMRFDETLNVVEDWDFLMRTSFLTGVANVQEITSVYRVWRNTENSAALHSQDEWDATRKKIIEKFDDTNIVLPKQTAGKLVKLLGNGNDYENGEFCKLWTFFVDLGDEKGFLPDNMIPRYVTTTGDGRFNEFYDELNQYGVVKGIRLDPSEDASIIVSDLKVTLKYVDGTKREVAPSEITGNSIDYEGKKLFMLPDPQIIVFDNNEKGIMSAEISGFIHYYLDGEARAYAAELFKEYKDIVDNIKNSNKKERKAILRKIDEGKK